MPFGVVLVRIRNIIRTLRANFGENRDEFCLVTLPRPFARTRVGVSVRSARALILKVKVLSAPVSGKHIANKTRVSAVRWNLKEVCGKPSVRRTEIMYKAYSLDKTADQVKVQMLTKGCE